MTFLTDVINYSLSPKGVSYGCDWGYTPKFEDTLIGCVSGALSLKQNYMIFLTDVINYSLSPKHRIQIEWTSLSKIMLYKRQP